MEFIIVLILVAILALYWCSAKEFARIAAEKGYPQKRYFWWCFLTSIIGYFMVIALPDHGKVNSFTETDELPEL